VSTIDIRSQAYNDYENSDYSDSDYGWVDIGDEDYLDVGGFWVGEYTILDDLPQTEGDTQGFLDVFEENNWCISFDEGDEEVTAADFEESTTPETSDSVDIIWYDGHGNVGGLCLQGCWLGTTVDYTDIRWGNSDLEWAFLHACSTLANDYAPLNSYLKTNGYFAQSLKGIHMICGASTEMVSWSVETDGQYVAEFLTGTNRDLYTVKNAWFYGIAINAEALLPFEDIEYINLRVIAEDESYEDDYIWGQSTGPADDVAVDDYYYSWDYLIDPEE